MQSTAADAPVMEGFILKEGKLAKSWKKRYFTLHAKPWRL
jgi:hypothetical protein